jgi:ABC-type polysaccharide/polyol phosphate transport system ATPase subunit
MVSVCLKNVTLDYPVYDLNSRSFRHNFLLNNKISKYISRSKHSLPKVGGRVSKDISGVITIRAIENLTFDLSEGDRLAILGHNGAGKSSLLRLISGIYPPTSGMIKTNGRIMSLFNMMEGISLDATGNEVIEYRGSLLGLKSKQIAEIRDEVVEFCELGEFMDIPLRTYSTGMQVRLAFAITTAINSDILIMDEFIGAGDASFFCKAQARIETFIENTKIMVIATHSVELAKQWCNKGLLLEQGKMVGIGGIDDVIQHYKQSV